MELCAGLLCACLVNDGEYRNIRVSLTRRRACVLGSLFVFYFSFSIECGGMGCF